MDEQFFSSSNYLYCTKHKRYLSQVEKQVLTIQFLKTVLPRISKHKTTCSTSDFITNIFIYRSLFWLTVELKFYLATQLG